MLPLKFRQLILICQIYNATRFPAANRFSLIDLAVAEQAASANVHSGSNQTVEDTGSRLRLCPQLEGKIAA